LSREFDLAKIAVRGAFHLFTGKIVSRIIGGLGGLILIRLLIPEEYGLITVITIFPEILMLFTDLGIGSAVTKYVAEYKAKGKTSEVKLFVYSGIMFNLVLGAVLTILCFIFSEFFASSILKKAFLSPLIQVYSITIVAITFFSLAKSVFLGMDATKLYVILLIVYEFLMKALPISLLIVGTGLFGVVLGMALASTISGALGISIVILLMIRLGGTKNKISDVLSFLRIMISYGAPLWISNLMVTGLARFYNFLIAAYCLPSDIGLYSAAYKLSAIANYITFPVSTVLFPMFSKISPTQKKSLKKLFDSSVKYSSFLILPMVALLMILARPLVTLFLGTGYEGAWIYLTLLALNQLFYGRGGTHLRRLLIAQGENVFIMKLDALNSVIGVILSLILIPVYGIMGLILAYLVRGWPSYLILLNTAYKKFHVKPPFQHILRYYASVFAMFVTILLMNVVYMDDLTKLVLGSVVGLATYLIAAIFFGAIKEEDVSVLRAIFKSQPIIGKIADKFLVLIEKILNKI